APDHIVTYEEFMAFRLFNRYTPMDLAMLIAFLDEHPDIRIITDTKDGYDAYTALYVVAEQFPDHMHHFIAQVYRFEHVDRIRALGFEDVIVTLYLYPPEFFDDPAEIARLARAHDIYAVTIQEYGIQPDYAALLDVANIRFFAHTVNNPYRAQELWDMGFYGIYTMFLIHEEGPVPRSWGLTPCLVGELERLTENISRLRLSSDEESLLYQTLIFRLDTPVYIHQGEPRAVGHAGPTVPYPSIDSGLVEPFVHYATGVLYLPWGDLYSEEVLLYRSRPFLSAETIEGFQVLHIGDYVFMALPHVFEGRRQDALLTFAEQLFD
ncbi:MAG: hypothetical protein FWC72_07545, partial [Oscillospiraceae bacterium]|nr:hypothetical protein [Oscillospiraceae bacterium]